MNCPSQLSRRVPSWATETAGLPRRSPEAISVGHAAMACCSRKLLVLSIFMYVPLISIEKGHAAMACCSKEFVVLSISDVHPSFSHQKGHRDVICGRARYVSFPLVRATLYQPLALFQVRQGCFKGAPSRELAPLSHGLLRFDCALRVKPSPLNALHRSEPVMETILTYTSCILRYHMFELPVSAGHRRLTCTVLAAWAFSLGSLKPSRTSDPLSLAVAMLAGVA